MLDRALLALPAVRSFRNRYIASRDALVDFLINHPRTTRRLHVVSAPCGLPRELVEAAKIAQEREPGCVQKVHFHGVDLDARVLRDAVEFASQGGLPNFFVHHGDAFDRNIYPDAADFITCTGLAEFLDDLQLEKLYTVFHQVLNPGGRLFTSGMRRLPLSDYMLELAELHTHYRCPADLEKLADQAGYTSRHVRLDALEIQSLMVAIA